MQPALVCPPLDSNFPCGSGWFSWKYVESSCLDLFRLPTGFSSSAVSLHQNLGSHSLSAGADGCAESDQQGMTGLVTKHSSPGSQAKESGAAMAGGAGREDDWQMPCLEPSPERRSVRSAAKRWGPRSPEMPMLVPAISKGPVEETVETLSKQAQLVLSQFPHAVDVDSIDGVAFFSFSTEEDLNEFAHSMDQLREEQYREPQSPDGSAPSSVARSVAADDEWRESDWAEERQSLVVLPRKTTDITKIKGWRRKAFGSDQTADQTTRWVMDQMNEKAWCPDEEETAEPPALMTRRAAASMAAAGQAAAPQLAVKKRENLPAAEASLSKGIRGAFLSSSLDEFLEHRAELRVGQLAQLNPNILPPPDGQGVLSLSSPPVVVVNKNAPRQVGPARQMTARPSRRYGRPQDRGTPPAGPSLAARRRRQSTAASDKAGEVLVVPSPSKSSAPATPPPPSPPPPQVDSPQKPAKRVKVEPEEDAPFLAMTSRRLRGSHGAAESSEIKGASTNSTPKKDTTEQVSKPSVAVASKKAATPSASEKEALAYGVTAGASDYPLVTNTDLNNEQKRLLSALLASTQCSRPLTVALPTEPCFICPQLDQEDAVAAALALATTHGGSPGKKPERSGGKREAESAAKQEKAAQSHAASVPKAAKKAAPSTKEPSSKGNPVEPPRTPRKPKARPAASGTQASPTESIHSTRTRREIRLPVRFQDSAVYFSPNGDLYDLAPSFSPWQRGRPQASTSSKAGQSPRPPPAPTTHAQPAAEPSQSSSSSSWCSSSSSSSSSPLSSRSSSPCGSCCSGAAGTSEGHPPKCSSSSQAVHINGGRTLRQLSRLKTDGFVSLHSIQESQSSSTPEDSIDINVESLSDSDEDALSLGEEPRMKNVDNRYKQKANQYLRCLKVLSSHLSDEKHWLQRRRAALESCLEVSRRSQQPARLPKAEPKPPPLPPDIREMCDLSQPMVPPLREASEEASGNPTSAMFSTTFENVESKDSGHSCSKSRKRHKAKRKEGHGAKSGMEQPPKHKPKGDLPQKVGESAAKSPSAALVEGIKCEDLDLAEMAPRSGELTPLAYTLNGGHIGALRSIPTPTDVPKKYTLYPTKGTALGDLSKLAAAAQHIIGPCIIKRVKLRSGQTVYVYRQPNADGTSAVPEGAAGSAVEEDSQPPSSEFCVEDDREPPQTADTCASELGQPACQDDEVSEVVCDNESLDDPSHGHEEGLQQGDDNDDAVLEDTSEWISGDGDTCIVMKLPVSSDEEDGSSSSSQS
ncbi:uncharacterized protein LOC144128544 isoform X5 [Amblyomma americanum]